MPTRLSLLDDVLLVKSPQTVSPGLIRRASLLSKRSNSRSVVSFLNSGPRVPMELLEEILKFYIHSIIASTWFGRESQQDAFSRDITPLTMASRDLRFLALRQFFETVSFISQSDANGLFHYLTSVTASFEGRNWDGGFIWVKSLMSPAFLISRNVCIIKHFTNLKYLHIDCSHCSLASQFSTFARVFDALALEHDAVPHLASLTMTNLPRLDESLLKLIAEALPRLTDLHLSTIEGLETECCPNCYEESLTRIMHSPIHEIYLDTELLATSFAAGLRGFSNLKSLYLGIFLSRSNLLDKHTAHGASDQFPSTVKSIANCLRCKSYARETRRRELAISLYIASHVQSLENISWVSAYCVPSSADEKEAEDRFIECKVSGPDEKFPFQTSLYLPPKSTFKTNKEDKIQEVDDQLHSNDFKVARFTIWRSGEKIRLARVV